MATAPKRSLFNKPKWATAPATSSSSGSEFYRHSGRVYKDILAENERKRQESLEKKSKQDDESDESSRGVKRRRLSQEHEDGSLGLGFSDDDGYEDDVIPSSSTRKNETSKSRSQVSTRSKGPAKSPTEVAPVEPPSRGKASSPTKATIIDLGGEGEEEEPPTKASPVKAQPAVVQELSDDSDSDEYVRELKRKAREKRKNQLAVDGNRASSTPDISRPASAISLKDPSHPTAAKDSPSTSTPPPPTTADDPTCRILITSPIPNTNPLIIERRASQRLQEVRQYWCQRQNFTPEFTRTVFLTWRSHRLYDISTCKSLAEKADRAAPTTSSKSRSFTDQHDEDLFSSVGDPSSSTTSSSSFMEKSKGQIAVEATTAELLEKSKQQARTDSPSSSSFHEDPAHHQKQEQQQPSTTSNPNQSGAQAPNKENDIRVLLRASKDALPGIPEPTLKLKVRASTPVWKVIAAFKDQRVKPARNGNVEGVEITLMFDGEALDPNLTMGGTEVEDTDAVDVVVRFV